MADEEQQNGEQAPESPDTPEGLWGRSRDFDWGD